MIGGWTAKNDTIIILTTTNDNKEIESEYIYKEHDDIKFLVSTDEMKNWPDLVRNMDSLFRSDEYYWMFENGNWRDPEMKIKMLKKTKIEIYQRVLFWKKPIKDIYIERSVFSPKK